MNPSAHPAALAAALVIALASGLRAQEAANATTKWRLTYHTHISAWVSDDEEIFDTRAEAERKAAILRQTNASNDPGSPVPFTNIRIAPITVPAAAASGVAALIADVEGRLGRIGESLDHLHEVATEILDAAERKPGAALADYANSIRDAYRRVSDLREKLLARQTELGKDAIRAANRRIDEYNAQADAFNAFLRSPPNSVRLAMVPTRRAPRPNGSFRGNRTPVEQTAPLTLPQPAQRIERLNEPTAFAPDQSAQQGETGNSDADPITDADPGASAPGARGDSTSKSLVGVWYAGRLMGGHPVPEFEITAEGTAIASSYFSNRGEGTVRSENDGYEIIVPATWGPFAGRPYLKWSLRLQDGKLIGERVRFNDSTGWSEPESVTLTTQQ